MAKTIHEEEYRLIDKVSAGFATIGAGVKSLSTRFTELNQASELAGKGIGLVVSAAKGIGEAVTGAADYEEAMRRVSIVTNATADEQVALQQAVRDAADTVGATADESAAALLNMARDGFSARDAVDSLGAVLGYAKAQATGAKEAAAGLGGILDSFGERSVTSVAQVADALTAAAKAAGTTTDTLEKGLGAIGVSAQNANLSFEQTVALLAQLATRNIEGASAAKQLATILDQFQDPASKAGKALADAGLAGADFSTILTTLSADSDAAAVVLESLGRKPREALTALLADGGGALTQMTTIIGNSEGAARSAAEALGGTFNDSLKRVQAQISILSEVAAGPILKPLADGLTVISKRLSDFAKSPAFDELIKQLTALTNEAVGGLADYISKLDFEGASGKISEFAGRVAEDFDKITKTLGLVSDAFNLLYGAVGYTADSLVTAFDPVSAAISNTAIEIKGSADAISGAFNQIATSARGTSVDVASASEAVGVTIEEFVRSAPTLDAFGLDLERIGVNFKATGDAAAESAAQISINAAAYLALQDSLTATVAKLTEAQEAYKRAFADGKGADAAWADVVRLGNAVADLRKTLDNTKIAADSLTGSFSELGIKSQAALVTSAQKGADAFRAVAEAARQGQATQEDVTRAFEVYAQRLAETATLADATTKAQIAQQIELAGHVAGVSQAVIDVATQTLKAADVAESSNARASAAWDKTAASVAGVTKETDKATAAAGDFADAGKDFAQVRSQIDDTTKASEAMSVSFGNISTRLLQSIQAATATLRGGELARELSAIAARAEEGNAAIERQIAAYERQNPALQEEAQIRRQLEQTYGVGGDRVERLVQLRIQENEERRRGIELAQREIEQTATQIEQANTQIGLAGGFGGSRSNQTATPAGATAAPASAVASKGVTQAVTINVQGLPTDRPGWRQAVEEFILPEIQRLGKLAR